MLLDIKPNLKLFSLLAIIMLVSCFSLLYPVVTKILIDHVFPSRNDELFAKIAMLLISFVFFRHFLNLIQDLFFLLFRQSVEKHKVYEYIKSLLSSSRSDDIGVGETVGKVTSFMSSFQYSFVEFVYFFCYSVLVAILSCLIMFVIDTHLLVIVLTFMGLHLANYYLFAKNLGTLSGEILEQQYKLNGSLLAVVNLFAHIKVYKLEDKFTDDSNKQITSYFKFGFHRDITSLLQELFQDVLIFLCYVAVIFYLYIGYLDGNFTSGDFILCFFVLQLCFEPVYRFAATTKQLSELQKMSDNLRTCDDVVATALPTTKVNSVILSELSYCDSSKNLLIDSLTYRFHVGNLYVIQGPSGCGKTTLIRLMSGNLDPSSGTLTFETDTLDFSKVSCCYLPQKYTPFKATITENVSLFSNSPNIANARLCIDKGGIGGTLASSDLDTVLIPYSLSGGERMKLGMAAMLYHDSNVYLLDEVFSNLDHDAALDLLRQLNHLKKDSIIIVVSHNSYVNEFADYIIDLPSVIRASQC
ncbi:ABC transporter transmembrane domain-containing protein [Vibrio maritimus]|uniref:ABC transporter transmembrane domain-containing protein n=1 Tax=Vibrio maritimus TaxID=990268 RepID=UPI0040689FE3